MRRVGTIMVVDDDEITCFLNKHLVDCMGASSRVECFSNAQQAITYLEQAGASGMPRPKTACDLLLLDLEMSVMDGYEFLDELKKSPHIDKNQLYVVVLTSLLTEKMEVRLKEHSIQGTYAKPLTQELLEEIIMNLPCDCPEK